MPASPKKCCGKNVMFTPVNITPNWIFNHLGFIVSPVNRGNHCTNPPMIANTAPIDST
jgi:hypothetical protein